MPRRLPLLLLLFAGCGSVHAAAADCVTLDLTAARGEVVARVRAPEGAPMVLVHEGHVAWRGVGRGVSTHRMRDYDGPDRVTVRVKQPGGKVCTKTDQVSD